jgi:hypothetical protein
MGFLDKAKQAAEQAKEAGQQFADRANDKVSDVQTQRELQKVYGEIGEAAFRLADSGAISHPDLDPLVARARELHQKLHEEGARVDSPHSDPPEAVEQPLSGAGPGAA